MAASAVWQIPLVLLAEAALILPSGVLAIRLLTGRRRLETADWALAGGVDVLQLREKDAPDDEVLRAAETFRRVSAEHDVPFILNDRPDLVMRAGADGVHLGQDDMPVAAAREIVGDELIVGRSTHTPDQVDAANAEAIDYFAPSGPTASCAF